MAVLDIRQRAGYLFLTVTLAQVILISAQVQSKGGVPVLEALTFGLFAEVQRATSAAVSSVSRVWDGYVGLRGVRAENEQLRRELAAAQMAVQEQRAIADRTRGLEQLLQLQQGLGLETVAARVIAGGAAQSFRTMTIDKGTADGVAADMAVLAPSGVVGRIVVASPRAAKVQLLVDAGYAAAGVLIERSRAQAIAVGAGSNDRLGLQLQYVSEVSDIVEGDVLVTSGIDGIYPKGFTVGRVESVEKSGTAFKQILVRPAVDFSKLEEVLVVLTLPPAREALQDAAP